MAYVEPSIRPDDARYGENPNRMGRHHQFQVILKPDPGDPQELYLDSLAALGIDLARHDIRFVEDNWESPALGAWGLGWEVWLDGLEITQFTYFQQAGGLDLDPVSVEITYGLDRILMALQDVQHFKDLAWNDRVRFGDVLLSSEVQTSRYYFEVADVERLTQLYDLYEAEALHALAAGLVRPAPRLRAEVLPHLQRPGRPGRGGRHRTRPLLRPHATPGAPGGRGLPGRAPGCGVPAPGRGGR